MDKNGVRGTISTVNILIGFFGDGEDLERCIGLIEKWDLKMNGYTYKCLVQAYLRSCDSDNGFRVYLEMKRKGYTLDIFAFNMLLDALAKDQKVDQAFKVFEDMKKKHCEPDEYTYTIMIRMTGRIGKLDESLALFEEMLNKGCSPNLIAYNTMIQALANSRMVDKTILLFSKMMEKNCRPNEFTYSVILTLLAAEGQLHKLDKVVELSRKYMNRSIYAYLVRTLNKLGHASEAHRLFCNMWSYHDRGDRDACLSMLESLCNAGKTVEAIDLLGKIHEKGINTDTIMYNTVFTALGRLKQISHLYDLYEKMKLDGPLPDIFTYNILISSFGRAGKVYEAIKIFEELENSDCKPDIISYNSLINCLGKNGDLDEAHIRFREMQEKGLNPDVVTYSTLIECFGKTDKVEMACRLFDEMLAEGCFPNIVTYNILLDCLERSGRTAEAVDLYAKLKQQGLTPDSITYSVLERLQSGSHRKLRVRRKNPITGWVVSPLRYFLKQLQGDIRRSLRPHGNTATPASRSKSCNFFFLSTSLTSSCQGVFTNQIHSVIPEAMQFSRVNCASWHLGIEANNIFEWWTTPKECKEYVKNYMLGYQYRSDSKAVISEAINYVGTLHFPKDGRSIWVFDIDETVLSNLRYFTDKDLSGLDPALSTPEGEVMPESQRLYKKLLSVGIKVVFLSGRKENKRDATVSNLKKAGYHSWDMLILK
ncbi:pentatricopeptide repeat-containing protein, putative [Ricinus communis]|uniref:Pentatricopeptide repeat-containing protein, putative n=1 Tax=Ricinus communis TaxID=3988 RepID=B9RQC9_RICCO|nr:pentatricopeptide repeat-containing protein, putative [Ricinus communis]